MELTFTPRAAEKLNAIIGEKGGNLALRIRVKQIFKRIEWDMTLESRTAEAVLVNGVPFVTDRVSRAHLEGMVVDWVQTPAGPGFGVFDRNLIKRDLAQGAD